MSKLGDYLSKNKIDSRRVLSASKKLEALRPEDRKIRLAKKQAKGAEKSGDEENKEAAAKARSGRPVSRPTMAKALAGRAVSAAARARILRAVNAVAEQKKKAAATAADLF